MTTLPRSRNLILLCATAVLLLALYMVIPGYHWAIDELVIRNHQLIEQIETKREKAGHPAISMEDKRLFKIADYWYIQFVRDHTPMNAVILLPPSSAVDTSDEFKFINSSEWMEYFLFPRLCVGEEERTTKPALYVQANYVAIVNGWGYDKLKYTPIDTPAMNILPIDSAPHTTQRATTPTDTTSPFIKP